MIVLILLVVVIVLGIIFARNVCKSYPLDPKLDPAVENQLRLLFGADRYGVNCMGESGGKRKFICLIRVNETINYELKVSRVESLVGVSIVNVQNWILNSNCKGVVNLWSDGTEETILLLDIPKDAPATTLKLKIIETSSSGSTKTHYSYIDIVPPPTLLKRITRC